MVVGAGFAGLAAARALENTDVRVTVIDQRNHHTFQPLLYQVATAGLDVDDICIPTRGIFQRQHNARALQSRVIDINFDERVVHTDNGDPIAYDSLVLALGAVTTDLGVPGVESFGFGLKNAADAVELRTHVLRCFEHAERTSSADVRAAATTLVIAGGGPPGVETAGGFAELIDRVLRRDFSHLSGFSPPRRGGTRSTRERFGRIVLVEGQDRLLGGMSPTLSAKAKQQLVRMGVEVLCDTQVDRMVPGRVDLSDGTSIATHTLVWAAGVKAHPFVAQLGIATTAGGRAVVDSHLRLPQHPEVFVVGDLAAARLDGETLVPQVAPAAMQQGRHAAAVLTAQIEGTAPPLPFRYVDRGTMATIGRNAAVADLPRGRRNNGIRLSGRIGWLAWLILHLAMLIGHRNRANVLVNWAWNYLTYDRGSRLIVEFDMAPEVQAVS